MKKRVLKRMLALFLAIILSIPMAIIPVIPASAGVVSDIFIDKMVDIGRRIACEGVLALSESSEASGHENVSKATAFIAEWRWMDAAEVAAAEAAELCEEILVELEELEKVVNSNDAAIHAAVSELQWFEGKSSLSAVKTHDIGSPISNLTGELEAFEKYVKVRNDISSNPTEEEQEKLNRAVLDFLFALSVNTSSTPNKSSFESLGKAVFTTQEVSSVMSNAIDNLIVYLKKDAAGHDYNVMSTAMEYAYYYYPYSHQQYDYVMTQVGYQLGVILEVMLMYNEFLALQYDYLSEYVDINTTEGSELYGNYNGWVEYFDDKVVTLSENIVEMLNTEYQVSPACGLSIFDYMKPVDAQKTVLQGTNSDGSTYTYDTYKLMTNTDNSEKNVYYLYGDSQMSNWYNESSATVVDAFTKISAPLSDGYNTYQMAASANDFKELFNTNAFSLNGGKIRNNLYDFDSNGNAYSLLNEYVSHIGTSAYKEYDSGLINKEYYAEFQMIDVDKVIVGMDNFTTEAVNDEDTKQRAVVFTSKNAHSQNVTARTTGLEGSELSISSGSETVRLGETKAIPSGNELTIKFKLPEGCRNFTLECRRTYDTFSEETSRTSSEILLNENFLEYITVDSDGYYSLTYQMPYSECTFVLDANEFSFDEEGRIIISCYDDLKLAADQIKNNPSLYAGKSYIVTADITIPENHTLEPIGTDSYPFTGTFDGQGYTINGLKFSTSYNKAGMFGVNKGTIKNIDFYGTEISGEAAGTAAGYSSGTIENVHVYASTIKSSRQGGGICGIQSSGVIRNCSVDGQSKINAYCNAGENNFATGGIVGKSEGTVTVENCSNAAGIEHHADNAYINMSYTGGIIGLNSGKATVQFCINTGSIVCKSEDENHVIGGICGGALNSATIKYCANRGKLSAQTQAVDIGCPSYVGGILGLYEAYNNTESITIESCYSAAQKRVTFGYTGGIVCGGYSSVTVTNCCYDSNLFTGGVKGEMVIEKVTVTDSEGKTTDTFQSGEAAYLLNKSVTDGTQVWYQNIDNGKKLNLYPTLDDNGENTVYKIRSNEGYSNYQFGESESVIERVQLRTYQRVRDENGRFTGESKIVYGYGTVDNNHKIITIYAMNTAERLGILMHQGLDGALGIMRLKGDYPKLEETSKELLESGTEEPDIYTDGNGCIFVQIKDKTSEDIPELTVTYEQKPTENYEPTKYAVVIKIVDVSQFANVAVMQTSTLAENDPDYDVILDDSVVVPDDTNLPFVDVEKKNWFYEYVKYVYGNDLMVGTSDTTFDPAAGLTREQIAMILYRMEGSAEAEYSSIFADVKEGCWYTDAVMWADQTELMIGYEDGTFGIGKNITREEIALVMCRYAEVKGYDISQTADLSGYPDSSAVSGWAEEAVRWAVGSEIIIGDDKGLLNPEGNVSRAECAAIIMRFVENE